MKFEKHDWLQPVGRTRERKRSLDDTLISIVKERAPRTYLEIGTREGGSLTAVLSFAKPLPEVLVICDPWTMEHGGTGRGNHDHIQELLEKEFEFKGRVYFLDGRSVDEIPRVKTPNFFDLVLIDGNHNPSAVMKDFEMVYPLVRKGGFIVLDDVDTFKLGFIYEENQEKVKLLHHDTRSPGNQVLEKL